MTGIAAALAGAHVVAALLIMIGIRSLALHQDRCSGSRAGARAIGAGAALWVLAELGAAPVWTDLLSDLRPWLWVGLAAAAASVAAVLTGSLLLLHTARAATATRHDATAKPAAAAGRPRTDERGTP